MYFHSVMDFLLTMNLQYTVPVHLNIDCICLYEICICLYCFT